VAIGDNAAQINKTIEASARVLKKRAAQSHLSMRREIHEAIVLQDRLRRVGPALARTITNTHTKNTALTFGAAFERRMSRS